jgi:chromosomal replication initiator protein
MTNQQLWQAVLGELELILSRANFTTWFKHTFIVEVGDGRVVVGVPNTFTKSWLEKRYQAAIVKALQNVLSENVTAVVYTVATRPPAEGEQPAAARLLASGEPTQTSAADRCGLNARYRFETFVVGKGNELAHAAAQAVASSPGQSYNPLFIYGGVGLGKTHLLQAIGLTLAERGGRLLYVTSERFTNDYIQSVRAGRAKEFKDRYRSVDLLLIDDIQFIAGKEGTQEEFFHTFNALHQNNKQIVLTSDRPPKAIPALEARLLSRFEWGMIADISQPDLETRIAILEAKCRERGVALEQPVIHYLATTFQQNIRELEGALNRLVAEWQFHRTPLSLEVVRRLFTARDAAAVRRPVALKQLMDAVCQYFDIPPADLLGKSRKRELVVPRQIIMYLLREEGGVSYPAIGQQIGERDHTTAIHACEKIKLAIETDERIRHDVLTLRQQIYST